MDSSIIPHNPQNVKQFMFGEYPIRTLTDEWKEGNYAPPVKQAN